MINLENYGKLAMKQEFYIKENKIINVLYMGTNNLYDEGLITIEIDDVKYGYICKVSSANKPKAEFKINEIKTVNKILSIAENSQNPAMITPMKLHNYDNATSKSDDTYFIDLNGVTLEIDKGIKLVLDDKYYADEIVDNLVYKSHYEFQDYGIYCNDCNTDIMYLLNNENRANYGVDCIELTKISKNTDRCSSVPNLCYNAGRIVYYDDREVISSDDVTYDMFGVINSGDNMLYESYTTDEYDTPIFASSLHPFFYDNFDTNLVPVNKYCIDQINRVLDDDEFIVIYTREVYDIDDMQKLIDDINIAKEKKEPSIEIID